MTLTGEARVVARTLGSSFACLRAATMGAKQPVNGWSFLPDVGFQGCSEEDIENILARQIIGLLFFQRAFRGCW